MELTNTLVTFLAPLLREDRDYVDPEPFEFEEEQQLVARLLHLVYHHNPDVIYDMLTAFRKEFLEGGIKRMKYTIPSLLFAYFKLARHMKKCYEWQSNPVEEENPEDIETQSQKKIFNCKASVANQTFSVTHKKVIDDCRSAIEKIKGDYPELALKLYIEFILCINEVDTKKDLDEYTYDVCTHVLEIYESEVADAEAKIQTLTVITGAVHRITCLGEENLDTLVANTTQYSAKLMKKHEQTYAILKCVHLFWSEHWKNEQKVVECFKKVLKLADVCWSAHATNNHLKLYVAILNKFLYFLNIEDFKGIQIADIQKCIDIIKSKKGTLEKEVHAQELQTYWLATCEYIEFKKKTNHKFESIMI
jgi:vacuolar protein sorting-associated protein 35